MCQHDCTDVNCDSTRFYRGSGAAEYKSALSTLTRFVYTL